MLTVIKVGGSLFDLPSLGPRLASWLESHIPGPVLLVPGGGDLVNVIRGVDAQHRLGEATAHWLAIDCLSVTARLLAALVPRGQVITRPNHAAAVTAARRWPILDPQPFLLADEGKTDALPHTWQATSDSVAALVARRCNATSLIVLKSRAAAAGSTPREWAQLGLVDPLFPDWAAGIRDVRLVNARDLFQSEFSAAVP